MSTIPQVNIAPINIAPAFPAAVIADPRGPLKLVARDSSALDDANAETASGILVWDIFEAGRRIGQIGLDTEPAEFDHALAKHCPALRVYVAPAWRGQGLATEATGAFMALLRQGGFRRPLLASHGVHDDAMRRVLLRSGFIYTGCRSKGRNGDHVHMIAILSTD